MEDINNTKSLKNKLLKKKYRIIKKKNNINCNEH